MYVFGLSVLVPVCLPFTLVHQSRDVYVVQYKRCYSDSDCCRHEVCAYGRVCYPTVKCRYGCPDGECRRAADDDILGRGFETCWPFPPCTSNRDCGHGNICTMHYNLGYAVCQYNLSIGSSLCYWERSRAARRRMRPPTGPGSPSDRWKAVFIGPSRAPWSPKYKSDSQMKTNHISDFMWGELRTSPFARRSTARGSAGTTCNRVGYRRIVFTNRRLQISQTVGYWCAYVLYLLLKSIIHEVHSVKTVSHFKRYK